MYGVKRCCVILLKSIDSCLLLHLPARHYLQLHEDRICFHLGTCRYTKSCSSHTSFTPMIVHMNPHKLDVPFNLGSMHSMPLIPSRSGEPLTTCTVTRQAEATPQCDELSAAQLLVPECLKLFIQCLQALPPVDGLLQWMSVRHAAVRLKLAGSQLHRCHGRLFFGFQVATWYPFCLNLFCS